MLKIICVIILLSISAYSQIDTSDIIVNQFGNHKYLKTKKEMALNKSLDNANLIIELDTFHVQYTKDKYSIWKSLPVTSNYRMPILDADNNGKLECYGVSTNNNDTTFAYVYEINKVPKLLYKYDGPFRCFWDEGSIKGDGIKSIVGSGNYNKMVFFKQSSPNSLLTEPDFVFNPNEQQQQPDNLTFYDIDGDGIQELIYYFVAGSMDSVWAYANNIAKYNPLTNNYEIVYYNRPQPDFYTFGIVTGDFDNDGKGNFATGSIDGKMYVYEYVSGNNYKVEFQKQMVCNNLYLQGFSHDMDGNGKPELWIGGDFNSLTYGGITRIFAFEPTGDDSYQQVYQIDIRGLFALSIGDIRVADFDNDGKEEVMVRNGNYMFFFKCRGLRDYYCDFIYLDPMADSSNVSQWGTDAMDLDKDGIPELLSFNTVGDHSRGSTLILKRNLISGISNDKEYLPNDFKLYQNYPNPFNGMTRIKYSVPKQSNVCIIIRDLLGRAIKTLISDSRNSGVYETVWDGTDDNHCSVSSGVYFISMVSSGYNKSIKIILLK